MSLTRRALAFALAAVAAPVAALDPSTLPPALGTTELFVADGLSGVAIGGFDPVAYFADGDAVPGAPDHEAVWNGIAWRFASGANLAAFRRSPSVYAPRLGGHDPVAAVAGVVLAGAPTLFVLADGRLYLFRSEEHRRRALADPALLADAERRWAELGTDLVRPR